MEINRIFERLQRLGQSGEAQTDPNKAVLVERSGSIATVTINRPEVRNALDTVTWRTLAMRLEKLADEGQEQVNAVILRGAGRKFSAGADVGEITRFAEALRGQPEAMLRQVAYDYFTVARETLMVMGGSPFVIIARMEGPALGIGNILALACDRRIADETVRTGVPAGILGIMLDPRELRRLVLHVGISNAQRIIYSGRIFGAKDSLRMGQVDTLVEPEALDVAVYEAANQAAIQSRQAIITAKSGFKLIARSPGFPDSAVTLEEHYTWAGAEAIRRIQGRHQRYRGSQ